MNELCAAHFHLLSMVREKVKQLMQLSV